VRCFPQFSASPKIESAGLRVNAGVQYSQP